MYFSIQSIKHKIYNIESYTRHFIVIFSVIAIIYNIKNIKEILLFCLALICFQTLLKQLNFFRRDCTRILTFQYNITAKSLAKLTETLSKKHYICTDTNSKILIFTHNDSVIYIDTKACTIKLAADKLEFNYFWNLCHSNQITIGKFDAFKTIFNKFHYLSLEKICFCSYLFISYWHENDHFYFLYFTVAIITCTIMAMVVNHIYLRYKNKFLKINYYYNFNKSDLNSIVKKISNLEKFETISEDNHYTILSNGKDNIAIIDKNKNNLTVLFAYDTFKHFVNLHKGIYLNIKDYSEFIWTMSSILLLSLIDLLDVFSI